MTNQQRKSRKTRGPMAIEIAPDDWEVTHPVDIRICQQPAKIFPFHRLPVRRLPQFETWQLNDCFYAYNQPLV